MDDQGSLTSDGAVLQYVHYFRMAQVLYILLVDLNNKVSFAQPRASLNLKYLFHPLSRGSVGNGEGKSLGTFQNG